jgi:hypothetical protein
MDCITEYGKLSLKMMMPSNCTLMIMFAFKFGELPDAWTNATQVMLGKDDPGEPVKINHIRQIQLVCAAMNMGFCMIWGHEMMKRATQYGLLSPYQFVESAATC